MMDMSATWMAIISVLVVAGTFFVVHWRTRGGAHLHCWGLAHFCLGVTLALYTLEGFGDNLAGRALIHAGFLGWIGLVALGNALFFELRWRSRRIAIAYLGGLVLLVLAHYANPMADEFLGMLAGATIMFWSAWMFVRRGSSIDHRIVGALFALRGVNALSWVPLALVGLSDLNILFAHFTSITLGVGLILVEFSEIRRRLHRRENELREVNRRLELTAREAHRSERLLQTMIDAIPAAIHVKDADLRYILTNRFTSTFFDLYGQGIIGRRLSDIAPSAEADLVERLDRKALYDGRETPFTEYAWNYPDGRTIHWWSTKIPLRGDDGKISGVATVALDISAVKAAQQATEAANAKLEAQTVALERINQRYAEEREQAIAANRAKSEFLANMSHELRTPLNAIIGYSEIMAEQMFGPLPQKYQEYSGDILTSGRHLLNVINDILDMAKIEAGQHQLLIERADLASIVEACGRMVRGRAEAKGVSLTFDIAREVPVTRVDSRAIKQVLLNLLSNAVKFTGRGGMVTMRCNLDGDGWLAVEVEDTGMGIKPENLERVFEPFWQAASAYQRAHDGFGLGLPISRKLIELHDGVITIESRWGEGTLARFRLPPSCIIPEDCPLAAAV